MYRWSQESSATRDLKTKISFSIASANVALSAVAVNRCNSGELGDLPTAEVAMRVEPRGVNAVFWAYPDGRYVVIGLSNFDPAATRVRPGSGVTN